jgi:hypothetical protein
MPSRRASARTARQRAADLKLVVAATVGVVLAGGLVAIGLLVATDEDVGECVPVSVGSADEVLDQLDDGPTFRTAGGSCSFWLALDDGDVVAYRTIQPDGCTLRLRRGDFVCDGEPVDQADLDEYPVRAVTIEGIDQYVVDLRDAEPTPAT